MFGSILRYSERDASPQLALGTMGIELSASLKEAAEWQAAKVVGASRLGRGIGHLWKGRRLVAVQPPEPKQPASEAAL